MILRKISIFGDSILKGIQLNPLNKRYGVNNNIDIDMISKNYSLNISNFSKFGCTIKKGYSLLINHIEKEKSDAIVMDYGGNDCDFNWAEVSEKPNALHLPHTPLEEFLEMYRKIIRVLKDREISPILTNLPPLEPQRFFDWFCAGLNRENILKWLGGISSIYRYQENYSRKIEALSREEQIPLVDLRGEFLSYRQIDNLLCEDGIHPNTQGQKVITGAFVKFLDAGGYAL